MTIYVDELPKCCSDCPCESDIWCNLMGYVLDTEDVYEKRPKQCPLQSLTNYTKQVRKEVCKEIRNKIEQAKLIYEWKGKEITIEEILNEIQGGR